MAERAERRAVFKRGLCKGDSSLLLSGSCLDEEVSFYFLCVCVNLRESDCRERARHSLRFVLLKIGKERLKDATSHPKLRVREREARFSLSL